MLSTKYFSYSSRCTYNSVSLH